MERRSFQTPLGEIWLWGETDAFDGDRPLILSIYGAFAAHQPRFAGLANVMRVSVLHAWLPGQHCPLLAACSIEAFAEAYSEALAAVRRERRIVVCGESAGALVALAMTAPDIAVVALDPPLRTEKLWPVIPYFRERLAADPTQGELLWNLFGLDERTVEPRDYRRLLDRAAHVIVGDDPLFPERPTTSETTPSLVDGPERVLMLQLPHIRLSVAPSSGHVVAAHATRLFAGAIAEAAALVASPVR